MTTINELKKDLIIVLRTAGERTVELCKTIIESQIDKKQIYVIEEKPFLKAVKKTFEIGSANPAKFLLAIDADILLYPDAIDYILYEANQFDSNLFFKFDCWVLDKFRGKTTAGVHFYFNQHSKAFFKFLKTIDDNEFFLRPEFDNLKKFCDLNNLRYLSISSHIVAFHDYMQYYRDLFNKYNLRYKRCVADKTVDTVKEHIQKKCIENPDDMEYMVVYEIFNQTNNYTQVQKILDKLDLDEKASLPTSSFGAIIESLSSHRIMDNVIQEVNDNLKNWIESHNSFKKFLHNNLFIKNLNSNTAIYGTGDICEVILSSDREKKIKAVIDNNPENVGSSINGIPVISIEQINDFHIENILIASVAHKDVIRERITGHIDSENLNIIALEVV